jgi:hypothetical protein
MFVPAQPQDAFDPRQPFNRAEARAAGLTPEMLFSRRFHKIFWDTYVAREVPITPLLRAKAVIRLVPSGSYISHHTAAELWGAAPPADGVTHVTLPSASGRQVRQGVRSHYRTHPAQTTLRKGLPISTPEQTLLDLAGIGRRPCGSGGRSRRHDQGWAYLTRAARRGGRGAERSRVPSGAASGILGPARCGLTAGEPASLAARAGRASGADCQFDHSWSRRQLAQALRPGVRALAADY